MAEDLTYFVFRRRIISNYSSVMLPLASGNSSSKLVGFTANGIKTSYKQLWGTLVNFNQRHFFVIF